MSLADHPVLDKAANFPLHLDVEVDPTSWNHDPVLKAEIRLWDYEAIRWRSKAGLIFLQ
jgi:hypothetical protein